MKNQASQYGGYLIFAVLVIYHLIERNILYMNTTNNRNDFFKEQLDKLLLDYIKDKKVSLRLNVYQKNARAISFYQREGFIIQCEGLDEDTGEKEYTMLWKQK